MIPLAQSHGGSGLGQRDGKFIGAGEGLDKDGGGGKGAEIDDCACPVKNKGFDLVSGRLR